MGDAVEAVHGLLRLMARGGGDVVKNVPGHGTMRNAECGVFWRVARALEGQRLRR